MRSKDRKKQRKCRKRLRYVNSATLLMKDDLATMMAYGYFFEPKLDGGKAIRRILSNSIIFETRNGFVKKMIAGTQSVVDSKAKWTVHLLSADGERVDCNMKKITTDPEKFEWAMNTPVVKRLLEFITENSEMMILA